jgi:Raf kinase inhibitor-like YbhB/YbcL family protein
MSNRPRNTAVAASILLAASLSSAVAQTPQTPPAGQRGGGRGPATPPLIMTTAAWEDGGVIPDKYTHGGRRERRVAQTRLVAGTARDAELRAAHARPRAGAGEGSKMDITHWLIWNIPGTSTGLPEGVAAGELPDGTRQVSLRSNAYMGPGAPPGPYHHYTFELYALDTKLEVPQGTPQEAAATRTAVVNAMDGHVLGKAVLVARFHRQ